ncbi:restriction endonuclease [Corallococcus interemptor]|uniref:nSTAND3 domain-containing NTPase n=1 Tax=Corallococcus interemptor TaxID=2316720 RepID=UPI003CFE7F36
MASYDFRSLSDYDFEQLVRDLLQRELKLPLESFAAGRDGGVDLRHSRDDANALIVQCKHYSVSGYSKLLSHLKHKERPKIAALSPVRYILATSVALSPSNKSEIQATLAPFIRTPQDIYGASELNGILTSHPDIERAHLKLYLASYAVLMSGLHGDLITRTAGYLENIEKKARLYVSNNGLTAALEILNKHSICIIAGIPGIGKTTLAEMLLLYHMGKGFSPVVVTADIGEAERLYDPSQTQIFIYDDFLGQTSLTEAMGKNEDARLESFMTRIEGSANKRLILTTREYILQQAQMQYEKLNRSLHLRARKYVLDLAVYSRLDRAKILYNHIYFSSLPAAWKQEILAEDSHKKMLDHGNFSPRLIETIVQRAQLDSDSAPSFVSHAMDILSNPRDLWLHPFERHLVPEAQDLLLLLALSPSRILLDSVEAGFTALHPELSASKRSLLFQDVLRTLDDSFIDLHAMDNGHSLVSLHNPSIRDFLLHYFEEHPDRIEVILERAKYYSQLERLCGYAFSPLTAWGGLSKYPRLERALRRHADALLRALRRTFDSEGLEFSPSVTPDGERRLLRHEVAHARLGFLFNVRNELQSSVIDDWLRSTFQEVQGMWRGGSDASTEVSLLTRTFASGLLPEEQMQKSALRLLARIVKGAHSIEELSAAEALLDRLPELFTKDDAESISEAAYGVIQYEMKWLLSDSDNATLAQDSFEELKSFASRFGYSIDKADRARIEERIAMLEAKAELKREDLEQDALLEQLDEFEEEGEIERLFSTLRDLED